MTVSTNETVNVRHWLNDPRDRPDMAMVHGEHGPIFRYDAEISLRSFLCVSGFTRTLQDYSILLLITVITIIAVISVITVLSFQQIA